MPAAVKVSCVAAAIYVILSAGLTSYLTHDVFATAIALLLGAVTGTLAVYDVHCVLAGHCNVWAWFKTAMLVLMSLVLIVNVSMVKRLREEQDSK